MTLLQTVAHLDQGLLDLRLLDHSRSGWFTLFNKSLRLGTHHVSTATPTSVLI